MRMVNFIGGDNWFNSDLINEVRGIDEGLTLVTTQIGVYGASSSNVNNHDILVNESVDDVMAYLSKTYTISFEDFIEADTGEGFEMPEEVAGMCYIRMQGGED